MHNESFAGWMWRFARMLSLMGVFSLVIATSRKAGAMVLAFKKARKPERAVERAERATQRARLTKIRAAQRLRSEAAERAVRESAEREMRETAQREAEENLAFFHRERWRYRDVHVGQFFGIQAGRLVVAKTQEEVLEELQPDRSHCIGRFQSLRKTEDDRLLLLEAFDAIRNREEVRAFWTVFLAQCGNKRSRERASGLIGALGYAFLLSHCPRDREDDFPVNGEGMVGGRTYKRLYEAFRHMPQRDLDLVPMLADKEEIGRWLLKALRLYAALHTNGGSFGSRASDEDLEDYRLGTD